MIFGINDIYSELCTIGETKRKVLPSWLKDELEKIEAKKQKEVEKGKVAKEKQRNKEGRANWRDEIESDEEEERKREDKKRSSKKSYRRKSPSPKRVSVIICSLIFVN